MRLMDKTVLITAAGAGMGRASAQACAAAGARVYATDLDGAALQNIGAGIETEVLDVRDAAAIADLAGRIGPLDGLFNCAGIVPIGTILDTTEEEWARTMDVNVTSMMRMLQAFLPGMLERAEATGTASVVNMSSMASSIKGFVNRAAYGTSKAAVIGLTKAIAVDYVRTGLRCNALCPGTVDTPSLRARISDAPDPAQAEKDFIARQPTGRFASVDDLTPMVVYLLSDESRLMTGQAVLVDGGVTI